MPMSETVEAKGCATPNFLSFRWKASQRDGRTQVHTNIPDLTISTPVPPNNASTPSLANAQTKKLEGDEGMAKSDRPQAPRDARWEALRRVVNRKGAIDLASFKLVERLGGGDIGTVYLAKLIGSDCLFAIKAMDKEFLAGRGKLVRMETEKEILQMLDHPFLPTLYAQFSTDDHFCLVMEYCPGGDLHVLRQKQPRRKFTESSARFYAAEVLLALEYLHMLGVVYRDLKPENILVQEDGHIMLSDFDLSLRCAVSPTLVHSSSSRYMKKLQRTKTESSCKDLLWCFAPRLALSKKKKKEKDDVSIRSKHLPQLIAEPTSARSNSFVGTHEYLAPEIIRGDGHGSAVDWWTFGVLMYELLYGRTPFRGSGNAETLINVVSRDLVFPHSDNVSSDAIDLIRKLLVKDPELRLGTIRGAAEIKQHPFFHGLNWALIRCSPPPEKPSHHGEFKKKVKSVHSKNAAELEVF